MTRLRAVHALACTPLVLALGAPAQANPASAALRAKAANHIYNLEHDLARQAFLAATAADPKTLPPTGALRPRYG